MPVQYLSGLNSLSLIFANLSLAQGHRIMPLEYTPLFEPFSFTLIYFIFPQTIIHLSLFLFFNLFLFCFYRVFFFVFFFRLFFTISAIFPPCTIYIYIIIYILFVNLFFLLHLFHFSMPSFTEFSFMQRIISPSFPKLQVFELSICWALVSLTRIEYASVILLEFILGSSCFEYRVTHNAVKQLALKFRSICSP